MPEPVDKWQNVGKEHHNVLQAFYDSPDRYAYTFQNYVFVTRMMQVCCSFAVWQTISSSSFTFTIIFTFTFTIGVLGANWGPTGGQQTINAEHSEVIRNVKPSNRCHNINVALTKSNTLWRNIA